MNYYLQPRRKSSDFHNTIGGYDFSHLLDRSTDPQTKEQELADVAAAQAGDRGATDRLIFANVRWVIRYASIAVKYSWSRMPVEDAVQCGLLGFVRGVMSFDPSRGVRLLTFVTFRIRSAIQAEMQDYLPIRVPRYHVDRTKPEKMSAKFRAEALLALNVFNDTDLGDELRERHGDLDLFIDPASDPRQAADNKDDFKEKRERLRGWLLEGCRPKDREVLVRRFGLEGSEPQTLKQIGDADGVGREWIRQQQNRGLSDLRRRAGAAK